MSAWEITEDDVRNVLDAHNIEYTSEQISDYLDELDHEEIIENLMTFSNFDTQTDSMMYDIESYFVSKGIVKEDDRMFLEPEENYDDDYYDEDEKDDIDDTDYDDFDDEDDDFDEDE